MDIKNAVNSDEQLLNQQGYKQELQRGLSLWSSFAVGFATVSPVVGIYAVMSLGAIHMGPAWVWIVPICLAIIIGRAGLCRTRFTLSTRRWLLSMG